MKKMLMMLMLGVGVIFAEQVPVEVQQIIDSTMAGKTSMMIMIEKDPSNFGFDPGTKLTDLKAGKPFHLYWWHENAYFKNHDESAPISAVIKPIDQWAVPLLQRGKVQALFVISKSGKSKNWRAVGYGHRSIARAWERVSQVWPESAGYHPIFIGILLGDCYFNIPEKGDHNLTSLFSYNLKKDSQDILINSLDSSNIALRKIIADISSPSEGDPRK